MTYIICVRRTCATHVRKLCGSQLNLPRIAKLKVREKEQKYKLIQQKNPGENLKNTEKVPHSVYYIYFRSLVHWAASIFTSKSRKDEAIWWFSLVSISILSFLRCFDTINYVSEEHKYLCQLSKKVFPWNRRVKDPMDQQAVQGLPGKRPLKHSLCSISLWIFFLNPSRGLMQSAKWCIFLTCSMTVLCLTCWHSDAVCVSVKSSSSASEDGSQGMR